MNCRNLTRYEFDLPSGTINAERVRFQRACEDVESHHQDELQELKQHLAMALTSFQVQAVVAVGVVMGMDVVVGEIVGEVVGAGVNVGVVAKHAVLLWA